MERSRLDRLVRLPPDARARAPGSGSLADRRAGRGHRRRGRFFDGLFIDIAAIERRRDRMVAVLRKQGYEVHIPEGTFYLLPRAPLADDRVFCALLAEEGVAVLPGHVVELPGYFRISLTASDEMVERSLPIFARVIERAGSWQALPAEPA